MATIKDRLLEYLDYKQLESILNACPDLDRIWLLTGEGDMLRSGEGEDATEGRISMTQGRPYYDFDFLGGFEPRDTDEQAYPEYNIDFPPLNREPLVWCNITGNSMAPAISHGDIIAITPVEDWATYLNYGDIYAIVTRSGLRTVKMVRRGSQADNLRLVPINTSEYDEQEIALRDILRVFAVRGCIKRF